MVRKTVRVVLIDGNPAGEFFERAAGHTALALAPAISLIRGGEAGKDFLMDPVVIPAPELTAASFDGADVVVLADVSRLPAELAATLADRTAAGAGLLILAGPRVDPAFYNAWSGPDGPLLPVELGPESTDEIGISPAASTFRHEAIAWATGGQRSDLGDALIRRWRRGILNRGAGSQAAAFANGDPFLTTRGYGRGRCVVAACAFDGRSGNLPARAAFVPLVHELVTWAAGGGMNWNLNAGWSPSVVLDSRSSGGLSATYLERTKKREIEMQRVDPAIDFDWGDEAPIRKMSRDNFTVSWKAILLPPTDGEYLLDAEVDDSITVRIDGKTVLEQNQRDEITRGRSNSRVNLQAGKPVPFEAEYAEESGLAHARLFWTPPGGVRHVIPSSAWFPADGDDAADHEAIDPLGRTREVTVSPGRRGRELRIDGPSVPGLYQVKLSPELRESIAPGTGPLPLVVRGDIAESRVDPLTGEDITQLRARTDVILPESVEDILAVLSGKGFGREITRTMAIAALILLLLETALARWISRSRRAGDDLRVDFGDAAPLAMEKGGWR
jgi:hypothetical protein